MPVVPADTDRQSYLEPAVGLLQAYDEFGEAYFLCIASPLSARPSLILFAFPSMFRQTSE